MIDGVIFDMDGILFDTERLINECIASVGAEYGINDTDQMSDWLYKFQSCGLLTIIKTNIRGQYGKFQKNKYLLNTDNYIFVSDILKDEPISRQLKGFMILLKCKCLNGTNTTFYSQNQLAKELNISAGTISNYMKEAVDKEGFLGLFMGGFKAGAVGCSGALILGYIASLLTSSKMHK